MLAQNRGGRPETYESWTGDCEATCSGLIGLSESCGNRYVVSDTLLKKRMFGTHAQTHEHEQDNNIMPPPTLWGEGIKVYHHNALQQTVIKQLLTI